MRYPDRTKRSQSEPAATTERIAADLAFHTPTEDDLFDGSEAPDQERKTMLSRIMVSGVDRNLLISLAVEKHGVAALSNEALGLCCRALDAIECAERR